jgi:hypothetical protein
LTTGAERRNIILCSQKDKVKAEISSLVVKKCKLEAEILFIAVKKLIQVKYFIDSNLLL